MLRRRRTPWIVTACLLGLGAFLWTSGTATRWLGLESSSEGTDAPRAPGLLDADTDLDAAAREEAARLKGFPGLSRARRGTGSIVGVVTLFVAGAGEKPLASIDVDVAGFDGKRKIEMSTTTADDGTFSLAPLPSLAGYVLRARSTGRKELVVHGVSVSEGRATDAGHLVFGAPTVLGGIAVDARGRPIAGARIAIERDVTRAGGLDVMRALRDIASAPGPVSEGETDVDGRFLVKGLPPGRYLVRVERAGYATAFLGGVLVSADGDSPDVRAILDPGAGFEGRVLDPEGRGLEGAVLVAVPLKGEKVDHFDRHETRSGTDGRYRLDTLVDGVSYFLDAHLEGRAPAGRIVKASGVTNLDLTLIAGGRIEGVVTDAKSGAPVPSAEVLAVTGLVGAGTSPVSTVADGNGRYAFANVLPGPLLLLECRAKGYAPASQGFDARAPRSLRAGDTLVVDVAMTLGGRVVGSVRGDDGRVLAYVSVVASIPGNRWQGETAVLTDARGQYVVDGLKPGTWALAVEAPGYASPVDDADSTVQVTADGPDVTKDFVLASGALVTGKITDSEGAAVPRARVALFAKDANRYGSRVRDLATMADATGRYRLSAVPPRVDVYLDVTSDDAVRTMSASFHAKAGETLTVDVRLKKGSRILGRVVDAGGRSVRGARVRFGHLEPEDVGRASNTYNADQYLTTRVFTADDGGDFVCDRVPPGTTLVKVEADGFAAWFRRDLTVPEEGDLAGVTATLEGATTIRGRVTDAETGAGIGGAWVYAELVEDGGAPKDDGRVRTLVSGETKPDGTYVLEKAPPSAVNVIVWLAFGYVTSDKNPTSRRDGVRGGASGVDFKLGRIPPPAPTPTPTR